MTHSSSINSLSSGPLPDHPLRIDSQTWQRDSHDLFDYEAQQVKQSRFFTCRHARVFRHATEVYVMGGEGCPTTSTISNTVDCLLNIKVKEGRYFIAPADRNVPQYIVPKKLWMIIRELPDQNYTLQEGDLIKLGRFKLKVKQLARCDGDVTPEVKLDDFEAPLSEVTDEEAQTMQCRICLLDGGTDEDPLICPCQCKGSIKFVHVECLRHWINGRLGFGLDEKRFFFKQQTCELCKNNFPTAIRHQKGEKIQIVAVPKTQAPFIVLENVVSSGAVNKGIHIISMAEKKDLKLGRGHESDVRIPDVSISRYHATIRYSDGKFLLDDHESKFGTLVALRRPQPIEASEKFAVQVGRTVLNFVLDATRPSSHDIVEEAAVFADGGEGTNGTDAKQEGDGNFSDVKAEPKNEATNNSNNGSASSDGDRQVEMGQSFDEDVCCVVLGADGVRNSVLPPQQQQQQQHEKKNRSEAAASSNSTRNLSGGNGATSIGSMIQQVPFFLPSVSNNASDNTKSCNDISSHATLPLNKPPATNNSNSTYYTSAAATGMIAENMVDKKPDSSSVNNTFTPTSNTTCNSGAVSVSNSSGNLVTSTIAPNKIMAMPTPQCTLSSEAPLLLTRPCMITNTNGNNNAIHVSGSHDQNWALQQKPLSTERLQQLWGSNSGNATVFSSRPSTPTTNSTKNYIFNGSSIHVANESNATNFNATDGLSHFNSSGPLLKVLHSLAIANAAKQQPGVCSLSDPLGHLNGNFNEFDNSNSMKHPRITAYNKSDSLVMSDFVNDDNSNSKLLQSQQTTPLQNLNNDSNSRICRNPTGGDPCDSFEDRTQEVQQFAKPPLFSATSFPFPLCSGSHRLATAATACDTLDNGDDIHHNKNLLIRDKKNNLSSSTKDLPSWTSSNCVPYNTPHDKFTSHSFSDRLHHQLSCPPKSPMGGGSLPHYDNVACHSVATETCCNVSKASNGSNAISNDTTSAYSSGGKLDLNASSDVSLSSSCGDVQMQQPMWQVGGEAIKNTNLFDDYLSRIYDSQSDVQSNNNNNNNKTSAATVIPSGAGGSSGAIPQFHREQDPTKQNAFSSANQSVVNMNKGSPNCPNDDNVVRPNGSLIADNSTNFNFISWNQPYEQSRQAALRRVNSLQNQNTSITSAVVKCSSGSSNDLYNCSWRLRDEIGQSRNVEANANSVDGTECGGNKFNDENNICSSGVFGVKSQPKIQMGSTYNSACKHPSDLSATKSPHRNQHVAMTSPIHTKDESYASTATTTTPITTASAAAARRPTVEPSSNDNCTNNNSCSGSCDSIEDNSDVSRATANILMRLASQLNNGVASNPDIITDTNDDNKNRDSVSCNECGSDNTKPNTEAIIPPADTISSLGGRCSGSSLSGASTTTTGVELPNDDAWQKRQSGAEVANCDGIQRLLLYGRMLCNGSQRSQAQQQHNVDKNFTPYAMYTNQDDGNEGDTAVGPSASSGPNARVNFTRNVKGVSLNNVPQYDCSTGTTYQNVVHETRHMESHSKLGSEDNNTTGSYSSDCVNVSNQCWNSGGSGNPMCEEETNKNGCKNAKFGQGSFPCDSKEVYFRSLAVKSANATNAGCESATAPSSKADGISPVTRNPFIHNIEAKGGSNIWGHSYPFWCNNNNADTIGGIFGSNDIDAATQSWSHTKVDEDSKTNQRTKGPSATSRPHFAVPSIGANYNVL